MSIIRNVLLSLETIIDGSNMVLEVEYLEAFEEQIAVPSHDPNNLIPDFIKKGNVFKVKRVLKNTSFETIPEIVRVPNESWKRSLSQHKEYYANGHSKSFTVKTYETHVAHIKDADILFLHYFKGECTFIAHNSFESIEFVDAIQKLIGL